MRVAVVIPCYDDGATLRDAVASLRDEEPHELVVVDDGSRDPQTLRVMEELRSGGVRVVRQENAGLSAARMAGVHATTAPYVLPLDADDAVERGALATLADALDADPGAAVAWGDITIFGDLDYRLPTGHVLDPWWLTYANTIPVMSLVRRDALLAVGGWCMGSGYEDWDLWMSFAERGLRGVHVDRRTQRYRRHGERMLGETIARRDALLAGLRSRHPALFASRRRLWRSSRAPWRARLLLPLVDVLPVSTGTRHRLTLFVNRPVDIVRLRRLRRGARG
jgi:glycosyltransferase involved in cell wall biosynthesis